MCANCDDMFDGDYNVPIEWRWVVICESCAVYLGCVTCEASVNEGDFDERARRYEQRSNPVMHFIEENCEELPGAMIPIRDFTNFCNEYYHMPNKWFYGDRLEHEWPLCADSCL